MEGECGRAEMFRGCKTYEWPLWIDGVKGGWIREEETRCFGLNSRRTRRVNAGSGTSALFVRVSDGVFESTGHGSCTQSFTFIHNPHSTQECSLRPAISTTLRPSDPSRENIVGHYQGAHDLPVISKH